MKKKISKDNPINRITFGSNVASVIVTQIAIALNVKLHTDKDEDGNILGVSAYIGNCIRLADHRTYLQTWVNNGVWDAPYRISIVIEDEETIGKTQVKEGYDFEVFEYVFKSQMMTPQKAREIAFDIKQAKEKGRFANNSRGEKFTLKSVYNTLNKAQQNISMNRTDDAVPANRHNHGADFVSESKNNKTNKNKTKIMSKKNTIKITESELKRVITESVKRVLKENMEQQYKIDLNSHDTRIRQQTVRQLHSLLNSGKPMKCELYMFYGFGFYCNVTFSTNGNSVCTMNVISSTQYNKTFEYPIGNAVGQALNIGENLCYQWLQSVQQNRQQPMQQQM